jgi:hypothetical protein
MMPETPGTGMIAQSVAGVTQANQAPCDRAGGRLQGSPPDELQGTPPLRTRCGQFPDEFSRGFSKALISWCRRTDLDRRPTEITNQF